MPHTSVRRTSLTLAALALALACRQDERPATATAVADSSGAAQGAAGDPFASDSGGLAEYLPPTAADSARRARLYAAITPEAVNAARGLSLVAGDSTGPDVLRVQVMLDAAGFSPGIMDGHWGHNSATALRSFQAASRLRPSGALDEPTLQQLLRATGGRAPIVPYSVTADDVKGPFTTIPESPYEQAELDCLCYESAAEALAERFHSTPELLAQLNGVPRLAPVRAGQRLWVPDVRRPDSAGAVARLVISRRGGFTQGVTADGSILFHFPSTLGNQYDPSPSGRFTVSRIALDPEFHYNPKLYAEVPDWKEDAMLQPGPNSPVGTVWIALSEPHYGIHGTAHPETIGYASSHGCVRLTNWDARWLAEHVAEGTPVEFR